MDGKAVSSRNAFKHGAYSMAILAIGERPEALEELRAALTAALAPAGPMERLLVERLVIQWWRLERAQRVERETLEGAYASAQFEGSDNLLGITAACRYDLPQPRLEVETPAQVAFHWEDGTKVERVLRYEGQVERAFFRLLHELERLQAKRAGGSVPAPPTVDFHLHGPASGFVSATSAQE